MERRLKRLSAIYKGGDSEVVQRCADYLGWAFIVKPTSVREVESNWRAFHEYIGRSGIDAADVPRALTLALARYFGIDEGRMAALVADCGAELLLAAMALPPQHRAAFLDLAPDERVPFLDGLIAAERHADHAGGSPGAKYVVPW